MIAKIRQWFCNHQYEHVMTYDFDSDLYRVYGIKREKPVSSNNVCKKCSKSIPVVTKTLVYYTNSVD